MPEFSKGISRLAVLLAAVAGFCLIPPEVLSHGPNLCLWRHLFRLAACPACGSTRALAALFHGHLTQALSFNRNVVVTGPGLLTLLVSDLLRFSKLAARRLARADGA